MYGIVLYECIMLYYIRLPKSRARVCDHIFALILLVLLFIVVYYSLLLDRFITMIITITYTATTIINKYD